MNDLPFERLRSVPGRKDKRELCGRFWGVWIKVVKIFLEGGGARLGVLAAIASDGAA
jgi:hypothetical protein